MDRKTFLGFIDEPGTLDKPDQKLLIEVLKEFPYCQSAHMLLVKALHNQDSIHYNNQLKVSAAYAADRGALYRLIRGKQEVSKPEKKDLIQEKEAIPVNPEAIIESLSDHQEEPVAQTHIEISRAVEEKSPPEDSPDKVKEVRDSKPVTPAEEAPAQVEKHLEKPVGPEKKTFYEWLKSIDNEEVTERGSESKNTQIDLIDQFLETSPKIVPATAPAKKEFYSPVDMARKSVEEHEDIYTETLAEIFIEQGNLSKAVKAFGVLSLKYPEKSSYFAGRIRELESLIKQKEEE